jgi:CRP-like cAMP-binding protein
MGVLDHGPRSAAVVARTPMRVGVIDARVRAVNNARS